MSLQTILLVLNAGLFVVVFTFGLNASVHDATYLFRRPGNLARALLVMNVLMPLFAVTLVLICDLNPVVKFTLVTLSVSPVLPVAPFRMLRAGVTSASAIGVLVASSVLAIVIVPLAMVILGQIFKVPLQMPAASIAVMVFTWALLPVALGIAVHSFAPALAKRVAKPILLIALIVSVACVGVILFAAAPAMWSLVGNGTVAAIAVFVIAGLAIGHFFGGPEPENRPALAFSTALRHPATVLAIAQVNFPGQNLVLAAALLYAVINIVVSIPYLLWLKRRQAVVEVQVKA
jgi:BASS family bile acid:Na+ symporter